MSDCRPEYEKPQIIHLDDRLQQAAGRCHLGKKDATCETGSAAGNCPTKGLGARATLLPFGTKR